MKEIDEFEALGAGAIQVLPPLHRATVGALFKGLIKVVRALASRMARLEERVDALDRTRRAD